MSLNFDLTKIENHKELCWLPSSKEAMANDMWNDFRVDPETDEVTMMNPVTKAIVFRTMAVGMGTITFVNMEEFYARNVMFERIFDSSLVFMNDENLGITPKNVHDHVGLSTNVSHETWAKWRNRIMDRARDEVLHEYKKWYSSHLAGVVASTS